MSKFFLHSFISFSFFAAFWALFFSQFIDTLVVLHQPMQNKNEGK